MDYRLITFGDVRLADAQGQSVSFPEKGLVAIAYLFSKGTRRTTRLDLASFLWGETDTGNVLVNLRQLISRIKARQKECGVSFLHFNETDVELHCEVLDIDLEQLPRNSRGDPAEDLKLYLQTITGEFLTGCDLSSERGKLWLSGERSRQLGQFAKALDAAAGLGAGSNAALVREAAFRLIELDAYSDIAYRALMKAYAEDGRLSQAKTIFNRYRDRLWSDLQTRPDSKTLALTRKLFEAEQSSVVAVAAAPRQVVVDPSGLAGRDLRLPRLMLMSPKDGTGQHGNFASALVDDITIGLCRAQTFRVVAPYTAARLSRSDEDLEQALQRHDIAYLLETRLQGGDASQMLFATMSNVATGTIVWAERFAASADRLPKTYNQIIHRIVMTTAASIEQLELSKISTVSKPNAYQHYLLGQHYLKAMDLPDIRRARKLFREALAEAPDFAAAWSGIARTEHLEWLLTARGDEGLLRAAETSAMRSILADGDQAGGYHQLGVIKLYQGGFDESIDAFVGAEQLSPSHADLIADYADTLVHAADPAQALETINRAIDLNPLCPDLYRWTAAGAHFFLGDYGQALADIRAMRDQSKVARLAAACAAMLGDLKMAKREMRRTLETYPDFHVDNWLKAVPIRETWKREMFREGLLKAGFH